MIKKQIEDLYGKIAYWISDNFVSDKDTLFFLHGMTADHTMFEQQFFYFERDFNIITWDAPAHGESRPYSAFSYESAANAMYQIIDKCGVSKVILIGQSMGGFIAQSFIQRYPEIVKGFVAIDTCPFGDYYSKSDTWWLRQIEWMSNLFPDNLLKKSIAKQVAVTEYGQKNMLQMIEIYGKRELCHLMGIGYAGFLKDNCELRISCPVVLLVGEKDNTGKVRAYNKEWARRTGNKLIWIPNAAHNSNVDNPETVNSHIKFFLEDLR